MCTVRHWGYRWRAKARKDEIDVSNPNEVRDFIWVEPHHGDYVMLSRAAGMLALHAAAASMRRNTPGFIPDERLGSDTTLLALELVLSGLWRRVEGGYDIADAWERRVR